MTGVRPTAACEILEWDSAFFGMRIARITEEWRGRRALIDAVTLADASGVDCLYLLIDMANHAGLRAAAECDFRVVDVRVEYAGAASSRDSPSTTLRPAGDADLDVLVPLARGSFIQSRFFADGRFPRERCEALFQRWLERSMTGELADVVLVDAAQSGFVACTMSGPTNIGRIELIAVAPEARRAGIGRALVGGAVSELNTRGATEVRV